VGTIVFYSNRDGNGEIYTMNADGKNLRRLTKTPAEEESPEWSPDGRKMVFWSRRDGNNEIYVMNTNGSDQINLTNHPLPDTDATWSPDGKKIAFTSFRDGGSPHIYAMDANGGNVQQITNQFDLEPSWSPKGLKIAIRSLRDGNDEIYVIDADGKKPPSFDESFCGRFGAGLAT
jgi:TolB protein